MRIVALIFSAASLAACSAAEEIDDPAEDAGASQATLGPAGNPPVQLAATDLERVCKAGQHHATGTPLDTMKSTVTAEDMVRISYTRDDGKAFRYDCRVTGNTIQFRMIDEAGPGTGPGSWSGRGSTLKFEMNARSIDLHTTFFDGSTDSETVEI